MFFLIFFIIKKFLNYCFFDDFLILAVDQNSTPDADISANN